MIWEQKILKGNNKKPHVKQEVDYVSILSYLKKKKKKYPYLLCSVYTFLANRHTKKRYYKLT